MHRTLALLSALVLAGACSSGGEPPPPAATLPSEVPTSTTAPAAPDPAVIPDDLAEIDEDYVQAVVDELFAVDAKATEIFVTTKTFDERAIGYLEAIYTEEEAERQIDTWFQALAHRAGELRPGTLGMEVQRVIDVAPDCVYTAVEADFSETTTREVGPKTVYLGLTPKLASDDPGELNPTRWMLFMNGLNPDGSEPESPCTDR